MYKYEGCGLPNVFLENGYELVETPYGDGVTIRDLEGLHNAIGGTIACSSAPITGAEFRFLRLEIDLSQARLGKLMGKDEQTVARWEKGKTAKVDGGADRLLRLLYRESKMGEQLKKVVEVLQSIDVKAIPSGRIVATETDDNWETLAQAA